jgi:hypothetical protein
MAFRKGDRVRQHAYGVGDIIEVNADYVTIAFDDAVVRKFAVALVRLHPSSAPRPTRSGRRPRALPVRPGSDAKRSAS